MKEVTTVNEGSSSKDQWQQTHDQDPGGITWTRNAIKTKLLTARCCCTFLRVTRVRTTTPCVLALPGSQKQINYLVNVLDWQPIFPFAFHNFSVAVSQHCKQASGLIASKIHFLGQREILARRCMKWPRSTSLRIFSRDASSARQNCCRNLQNITLHLTKYFGAGNHVFMTLSRLWLGAFLCCCTINL